MGKYVFILPDLGEGIVSTEITEVLVNIGDNIAEDDNFINVLTDKAVIELPSPVAGTIIYLAGKQGDTVSVGTPIAIFEVQDALANVPNDYKLKNESPIVVDEVKLDKKSEKKKEPQKIQAITIPTNTADVLTSPYIRRIAFEQNIDLTKIKTTGENGRITQDDFDRYVEIGASYDNIRQKQTGVVEIPLMGMRRIIAKKMQESKRNIPHITYVEEVDVTAVEELRQAMNGSKTKEQTKLTILPFLMLALVKACNKYPKCNSTFDDDAQIIYQHAAIHIGIAAMTDKGLMVPVAKHSETLDIWGAASEILRLSEVAKSGVAKRDELIGSTITITSLGKLGGLISTPIINAPEVAIIGVNKIIERPMVVDGEIVIRKMMNLSSSFDHRIIDGYDAAEFVNYIKLLLENPAMIFV